MKSFKIVGSLVFIGYCLVIYAAFYTTDKDLFALFTSLGATVYLILLKKFTKKWEVRDFGAKSDKNPLN